MMYNPLNKNNDSDNIIHSSNDKQVSRALLLDTAWLRNQWVIILGALLVLGSFGLFVNSKAASVPITTLETEQMTLSSGATMLADTTSSQGKAVRFTSYASAKGDINIASPVVSVNIVAKNLCRYPTNFSLTIDGRTVVSNITVNTNTWKVYGVNTSLSATRHSITIKSFYQYGCYGGLYIDNTTFYGNSVTNPPAPSLTLSASPVSVITGGSSTLSWTSANTTGCTASGAWSGAKTVNGTFNTGSLSSGSSYTLGCSGNGGSISKSVNITVAMPPIKIGAYPGYDFPGDIDTYTALAGRKPDVVFWFQNWNEPLYYSGQIAGIEARGVMPQITWSPEGYSLSNIIAGNYDSYINTQAQAAKSYGKPMQIRLAHEFNGPWTSYCSCVNNQTSAQFISFWKHVVDIFRANGVTNVQWVWSPNIYVAGGTGGAVAFDSMYPGDSYVDWVGLDGYNFGPPNNLWQSLITVFKPSYDDLAALTSKPIMLAEWGSTENAGDKAAWIRQGFLTDLPNQMPRVQQVDSFDRIAESDFRINSSPTALAAYQDVLKSALYGSP